MRGRKSWLGILLWTGMDELRFLGAVADPRKPVAESGEGAKCQSKS